MLLKLFAGMKTFFFFIAEFVRQGSVSIKVENTSNLCQCFNISVTMIEVCRRCGRDLIKLARAEEIIIMLSPQQLAGCAFITLTWAHMIWAHGTNKKLMILHTWHLY